MIARGVDRPDPEPARQEAPPPPRYPPRMARSTTIELASPAEKALLVAVDTGEDTGWNAQD